MPVEDIFCYSPADNFFVFPNSFEELLIYLGRNPLDVIPSYISTMRYGWRFFGDPLEDHEVRDYVLDMAQHWYTYPLGRLESAPRDSYIVVRYDDLVGDPEQTVADIYDRFGLDVSAAFAQVLREETEKARNYHSLHRYSLRQMGLAHEQIVTAYRDVFDRFGFDYLGGPRQGNQEAIFSYHSGFLRVFSHRKD